MKIILLLPVYIIAMVLVSCESEYQHQLSEAKDLVNQELRLRESVRSAAEVTRDTRYLLKEVEEEIAFRAHLSGNEEAFLQELDGYKHELLQKDPFEQEVLLSKYP